MHRSNYEKISYELRQNSFEMFIFHSCTTVLNFYGPFIPKPYVVRFNAVKAFIKQILFSNKLYIFLWNNATYVTDKPQSNMAENVLSFFLSFYKNYPTVPLVDNSNDWSNVCVNTDLSFGTIRSMEVTMMADIKEEFEKLSRIGESNGFYWSPVRCIMYLFCQ